MRTYALLLLALTGCATARTMHFVDDAALKFDQSKYPEDGAEVLLREDITKLVAGNVNHTVYARHEVIAVLDESAQWLGQVRVPMNARWTFKEFSARIIRPDGTREEFTDTALLSDMSGKGDRDSNARFFTFPNVAPGCILEYAWAVDVPYIWGADEQETLGNYPVKRYRFELTASPQLQLDSIELNGGAPIEVRTGNDGAHTLRFELTDLPPRRDADAAPHWTYTEPRWAWRVLAFKWGATTDWLREWTDVLDGRGETFFADSKVTDGFKVRLEADDCSDARCWAARALKLVKKKTRTNGVDWKRSENLATAWSSGKASASERALMVKELLAAKGLDVWLAYGTGKLSQQTMPTFPNVGQFDRLFVYVPTQRGVTQAFLLDPACDACSATQTEAAYSNVPVFVFKTATPLGKPITRGRWERAWLDPVTATFSVKHVTTLQPSGDLRDTVSLEARGARTADNVEAHSNPKYDLGNEARTRARQSSPLAYVEDAQWGPCNDDSCEWNMRVLYPSEAPKDGQRWLVPTTFLRNSLEEFLLSKKRQVDLHFSAPDHFEEVAELNVPENLKLVSLPAPVTMNVDGLSVDVRFEPTPTGVRITRKLDHDVVSISKRRYEDAQAAIEAFRRARREVLVFAPK